MYRDRVGKKDETIMLLMNQISELECGQGAGSGQSQTTLLTAETEKLKVCIDGERV